jgi:hypothetical protein
LFRTKRGVEDGKTKEGEWQKEKELQGRKPYHEVVLGPNPRPVTRGVARDAAHRGAEHVHDAGAAAVALQLLHVPAEDDARAEQPDAA